MRSWKLLRPKIWWRDWAKPQQLRMSGLGSYFGCSDSPPGGSCFTLAIETGRDPKFSCCGHGWREMVCQYRRIWHDEFTHAVRHPGLTTEDGGWYPQPKADAERRGLRALVLMQMGFHHLHSPWKHLHFRTCHVVLLWSLWSFTPNGQAPGFSIEKSNWKFEPLWLSSPGDGMGRAWLQNVLF